MARRTNRSAVERPGGGVRRLLDVWGWVPGFAAPHEHVRLPARDGVRLGGSYLAGPGPSAPAVVFVHGFGGHHGKPRLALLAEVLSEAGFAVLALDLRGHGRSQGRCTLGDREELDVLGGADWLRARGHGWVALLGLSMGGTAVLRAAGGEPDVADAVCTISTASRWGLETSRPMRTIGRLPVWRTGRAAVRVLLRTRMAAGWEFPEQPLERVGRLAPAPLLLVHGADDHYFGPEQAEELYLAARGPKALWIEPPGFGHAEDGLTLAFDERLAAAFSAVRRTGRWPRRDEIARAPGPAVQP